MKKKTLFPKLLVSALFAFSVFFINSEQAEAQQEVYWYVNPVGNMCVQVPDASYVLTPEDTAAGFVTIEETCSYGDSVDPCNYAKCTAPANDTYNSNGAVASFGATLDKGTYNPGEQGMVTLVGSLDGYPGSSLYEALRFFTFNIPIFSGAICFISGFLGGGCPVVRQVNATANMFSRDDSLTISEGECLNRGIDPDPNGFGFLYERSLISQDIPGLTCRWTGYRGSYSVDSEPRLGRFVKSSYFKAPMTPGNNYSINLSGCHEKFYCVSPAPLNFTVGPVTPPTIQIRFSDMLQKVKDLFAFI